MRSIDLFIEEFKRVSVLTLCLMILLPLMIFGTIEGMIKYLFTKKKKTGCEV
jgi:hypothetical protein